jgi:transcription elongation factor GreA
MEGVYMQKTIPVTERGFQRLKDQLAYLKNVKLKEVNDQIEKGKTFCDFDEDPEHRRFLEEVNVIQKQIADVEFMLKQAEIIEKTETDAVEHGKYVTFKELPDGLEETYQMVSVAEADPQSNHISDRSPIGRKILGRKENDLVSVETPEGKIKLLITKVEG